MEKETKKLEIIYDSTPSGIKNVKLPGGEDELVKVMMSGDETMLSVALSVFTRLYLSQPNREKFLASFFTMAECVKEMLKTSNNYS